MYWRNNSGTLAQAQVDTTDHFSAILEVKEFLVQGGEGYNEPVLAVIPGGEA